MSSSNTDTTTLIDEKKKPKIENIDKIKEYLISLVKIIVKTFIYFIIGVITLYIIRLASSGYLNIPDEDNEDNEDNVIDNIDIENPDCDESKTNTSFCILNKGENEKTIYQKLKDKADKNEDNRLLDYLLTFLMNLIKFQNNFLILFKYLKDWYEWIIIFGGYIIIIPILILYAIINYFYLIYNWFASIGSLFKEGFSFISLFYVILIIILFSFAMPIFIIIAIFSVVASLLMNLSYPIKFNKEGKEGKQDKQGKEGKKNILNLILLSINKYEVFLICYLIVQIVIKTFKILGSLYGVICLIILLVIYFGFLGRYKIIGDAMHKLLGIFSQNKDKTMKQNEQNEQNGGNKINKHTNKLKNLPLNQLLKKLNKINKK